MVSWGASDPTEVVQTPSDIDLRHAEITELPYANGHINKPQVVLRDRLSFSDVHCSTGKVKADNRVR